MAFRDETSASPPALTPLTEADYERAVRQKGPINRERIDWLFRHVSRKPGRAADIGTKDGTVLRLLQDAGWDAIGYDPDTRFHAFAAQRLQVTIRPDLFAAETTTPENLDLVVALHLIEHVTDPLTLLATIRRALRSDGVLYLETPNLSHIRQRQLVRGHVVLYTSHTLRQTVRAAGFRIVAETTFAPGGNRTYDQLALVATPAPPPRRRFTGRRAVSIWRVPARCNGQRPICRRRAIYPFVSCGQRTGGHGNASGGRCMSRVEQAAVRPSS